MSALDKRVGTRTLAPVFHSLPRSLKFRDVLRWRGTTEMNAAQLFSIPKDDISDEWRWAQVALYESLLASPSRTLDPEVLRDTHECACI